MFTSLKRRMALSQHIQVLVVVLAFVLMVVFSSYFMGNIVKKHLVSNAEASLDFEQVSVMSDMQELETMLDSIAETIRIIILRENSFDMAAAYMTDLTRHMKEYFTGAYGVFDAFGGKFYAGHGWEPPDNYVPQDRPWYRVADEANGKIGVTEPYIDMSTNEESITFARRIFSDENDPLAVICLTVGLSRIRENAANTYFTENDCGILLSKQLEVIAHPEADFLGKNLRDLIHHGHRIGISYLADDLEEGKSVSERRVKNHKGEPSVAFFRKIENGWYIGVVTPEHTYYAEMRKMRMTLILLGSMLTLILCAILFRIISQKQKSDERMRALLGTTMAKIREADGSKKTTSVLKNILNGLDAMIYVTVPHTGEILFINDVMKRHYGIEGDCVGQLCYKILQKDKEKECEFCPCRQLDKSPENAVVWIENSSLTKRAYRNTDRYIEWPGGTVAHLQHSIDITELNVAKEDAIQANNAKSNFLARVSHEIRTPMNAIVGITEIQLQNETLPPNVREALAKIHDSGYLLLNIINDILDLSKIEAGKLELVPVKYDVASLLNDTVYLNVMRFDNKPIEFTLQVDEAIPAQLYGDELRIKQILNNLLSNAFKYTDSGKVSLSVAAEYTAWDEMAMVTLVFRVSDTGQGMTREQVNMLFTEYTRFNMDANRMTEGTGLGLNITRQLIHRMNGEISVESEQGKGSVFTVKLPQGTVGSDKLGRELAENLSRLRHSRALHMEQMPQIVREYMPYGRVLVVDDVETNLYVIRGLLAPYGLSIETASSGQEAIEKIKAGTTFDIIYMDHFMPKMDGMETVKIIRSLGYKYPIIALTANALAGQETVFLANGFDGFISKPIDIRQLNTSLNDLIRDKYPPETVEAARRLKNNLKKNASGGSVPPLAGPQIAEVFVRDAEKAIAILESISKKNFRRDDDIQSYIINVHAMKSALANIGETELSSFARELEQAARDQNIAMMVNQTPMFLDTLRIVIERNRPKEDTAEDQEISDEDQAYLRGKLDAIQAACTAYRKKDAKEALADLSQKTWPRPVRDLLTAIAGHLLHSEFEEAAAAAGNFKT